MRDVGEMGVRCMEDSRDEGRRCGMRGTEKMRNVGEMGMRYMKELSDE